MFNLKIEKRQQIEYNHHFYQYKFTAEEGKSKKKKIVKIANISHRNAISKPGELCMVTRIPNNMKSICFSNIVKQGPIRRPI